MHALQQVFLRFWRQQSPQHILWLPALLALGMALYFALPFEPDALWHYAPLCVMLLPLLHGRLHAVAWLVLAVLVLISAGIGYAAWRTSLHPAVMLREPLGFRRIEGRVSGLEMREKSLRITLSDVRIEGLSTAITPANIRISLRMRADTKRPALGQYITTRAALFPPSGPAMPGSFDFARYFYMRGIGAVGFAIPPLAIHAEHTKPQGLISWLDGMRQRLTQSIQLQYPGAIGAVAAGIITGDDGAIPEAVFDDLRASNLLHIIAISGAHLVAVGGIVFVCLRTLLVLIPGFGLRPAVKYLTAALTLLVITAYVAITGFELSAVRAYIMMALVLIGILIGREIKPLRAIMLAAFVMLIYNPADVIEPGFQLSFAATLALIALFEGWYEQRILLEPSLMQKFFRSTEFLLLTSVVAQLTTTPIILFHFNNITSYGVLANLVMTPFVALLIMPMVPLYFLLLPLGVESLALDSMAYGIRAMLFVAETVSDWPYALHFLPSPTDAGMGVATLGLLWLCLWKGQIRWWGLIPMIAGTASLYTVHLPRLYISPRAAQIAYRSDSGAIMLRGTPYGLFAELWAHGSGASAFTAFRQAKFAHPAACKRGHCSITLGNQEIHFSHTVADIKSGCPPQADYWISGYYLYPKERKSCNPSTQFIDRRNFDAHGAYWVHVDASDTLHFSHSRAEQGSRPWSVGHIRRTAQVGDE